MLMEKIKVPFSEQEIDEVRRLGLEMDEFVRETLQRQGFDLTKPWTYTITFEQEI